jgi:hypothetical protein
VDRAREQLGRKPCIVATGGVDSIDAVLVQKRIALSSRPRRPASR